MLKSLPVLMYHYISSWPDPIAVDPEIFDSHLTALTKDGYRGISLQEAEDYLINGKELPAKSVLITFDDGFLDNFVSAWPLLKSHGHNGVVFAVTNKIVHRDAPRPTLDDVWNGFLRMEELPQVNSPFRKSKDGLRIRTDMFFSWKEALMMESSGAMNVAAHTHTHRSVFTGPRYEKLFKPGGRRRTFDRIDQEVIYGLPNFERGPAMANRAFLPSKKLYERVRELVPQEYGEARRFLENTDNIQKVHGELAKMSEEQLGRMETDDEFNARLRNDLTQCKETIETNLGHSVRTLAWPWGKYCQQSLDIAKEIGFEVFFTTQIGPNLPGQSADAACRFKAKNKSARWLMSRVNMYSTPFIAKAYRLFRR